MNSKKEVKMHGKECLYLSKMAKQIYYRLGDMRSDWSGPASDCKFDNDVLRSIIHI